MSQPLRDLPSRHPIVSRNDADAGDLDPSPGTPEARINPAVRLRGEAAARY
jgi:hypothetical protein